MIQIVFGDTHLSLSVCVFMRACVRACVCACVRTCFDMEGCLLSEFVSTHVICHKINGKTIISFIVVLPEHNGATKTPERNLIVGERDSTRNSTLTPNF